MKNIITFFTDNWYWIGPLLWILIRLIPTEKNYDIAAKLLQLLDRIVPNIKKGGRLHTIVFLCALLSYLNTDAQTGAIGNFKAIRLVNGTATIAGTQNGTIYYNTTDNKFYFRQGDSWVELGSGSGTISGTTGAVDNAILRADGVGGTTIQSSALVVSDAGVLSGITGISATFYINGNLKVGTYNTTSPTRRLHVEQNVNANTVQYPLRISTLHNQSQGDAGLGAGIEFCTENSNSSEVVGSTIESVIVNPTNANESFDLVFKNKLNGSLSEYFRIENTGDVGIGTNNPSNVLHVVGRANNDNLFLVEADDGADLINAVETGGATSLTLTSNTTIGNVSSTELNYLDGVTSAIQSQIDGTISKSLTRNRVTTDYTLSLTDNFKLVEMNSASSQTITVPPNSSVAFPVDQTQITLSRYGAGAVTVVAGSGVTIRSADSVLGLRAQYSSATLVKIGTDEWYLIGDLQ